MIELIAVLLISGILAGLSTYSFFGTRDPLRSATQEAANALKYSRSLAIATTSACRTITSSASNLLIECNNVCTASSGWTIAQTSPSQELDEVQISQVNGEDLVVGDTIVCFDSRGAASDAGSIQLSFTENGTVKSSDINIFLGGGIETSD